LICQRQNYATDTRKYKDFNNFMCALRLVFLNPQAVAQYQALASIIPGRKRLEENTICHKISLVQLITNLNVILYLSTCHTIYVSVLILFMIMPQLIINTYVSLIYELKKKIWKVFTSKFVGTGPSYYKKIIYRAAVSQRLRNTGIGKKGRLSTHRFSQNSQMLSNTMLKSFIVNFTQSVKKYGSSGLKFTTLSTTVIVPALMKLKPAWQLLVGGGPPMLNFTKTLQTVY